MSDFFDKNLVDTKIDDLKDEDIFDFKKPEKNHINSVDNLDLLDVEDLDASFLKVLESIEKIDDDITKYYNLKDDKDGIDTKKLQKIMDNLDDKKLVVEFNSKTNKIIEKLELIKIFVNGRVDLEVWFKYYQNFIRNQRVLKKLQKVNNYCQKSNIKFNIVLYERHPKQKFSATAIYESFENITNAHNQVETFINKLNSTTINQNGKKVLLSPLEKYFIVHKFVANRVFNMAEDFFDETMRNWIGVLTGDKVICSGFSALLKLICDRAFYKDELACYTQGCTLYDKQTGKELGKHANNLIVVNDEKYKVSGLFTSDTCWDSKSQKRGDQVSFRFCLNPITIFSTLKNNTFEFTYDLFFYKFLKGVKISKDNIGYDNTLLIKDIAQKIGVTSLLNKNRYKIKRQISKQFLFLYKSKNNSVDLFNDEIDINCKISKEETEMFNKGKDFLIPSPIPKSVVKKCLKAVAVFDGLTESEQIEQFVNNELQKIITFKKENSALSGIDGQK